MSGDGNDDVKIPMVFLFYQEGLQLKAAMTEVPGLKVFLGFKELSMGMSMYS